MQTMRNRGELERAINRAVLKSGFTTLEADKARRRYLADPRYAAAVNRLVKGVAAAIDGAVKLLDDTDSGE